LGYCRGGLVLISMCVSKGDQIQFLLNVQRLLAEGQFTATYKFALLMALADLSVARGDDSGGALDLSAIAIAEKFVEYYWRQTTPFLGQRILSQNKGGQPVVIALLAAARDRYGNNLAAAKKEKKAWDALLRGVALNIRKMPLRYLQNVHGGTLAFLYDSPGKNTLPPTIRLYPGVAFCFRRFRELIAELVRGVWVRWVHQQNLSVIGDKQDLHSFLFETERSNLGSVREVLQQVQSECFYCERQLPAVPAVDHFIPWALYPLDLGHNFVLAHAECNNQKRDLLAAEEHLVAWVERNRQHDEILRVSFDRKDVLHDLSSTMNIARWAYSRAATTGVRAWKEANQVVGLTGIWSSILVESAPIFKR
jgi:hypothetical protein